MARLDHLPDDELARAAARGEVAPLETLLARHADRIHAICRRVVIDSDEALDATQEAMIAIARGITRFDGRSQFTTWLFRVATNAALDEVRRRKRRPVPVAELPEPRTDLDPTDRIADRLLIDAALGEIPPEFRAAVALRDLAGLDYAEIAEVLGVPPGTVRSRIARGRAALASRLGNQIEPSERQSPMS